VRTIEPHSEADPAALLVQTMVAFGNCAGRSAHFAVEGDRHYPNLNAVLVGATSKGRKGTSWSQTKRPFEQLDEVWTAERIQHGLSSGEGLIWAVRDAGGAHDAVDDKRLLVLESEFANVLRVMAREGNTLSPVIRQAWDTGDLRILTRNNPAKATETHISIVGHITAQELRRNLSETEAANGFANRFLWVEVRRSKCLPEGGQLDLNSFLSSISLLRKALEHARNTGEMKRDSGARELWRAVYPDLSAGSNGLFGAVTSRAEAQVMRLALVYALLDQSDQIRLEHLDAALALWHYCEASARHIFGESTGNKTADAIVIALKDSGRKGMTKTDLANLFNRNQSAAAIDNSLGLLLELSRIKVQTEPTGGRAANRYFLIEYCEHESNELNELSGKDHQNSNGEDNEENEINEESSVVSIPFKITASMRQRLRECGETDAEIDAMKPNEAYALLGYFEGYQGVA